ncbi:MAG: ribonuclease HII, partial [Bacillus sp. (in: Bacteria)]|nr:ribonuclease HII [Bacillus sp. (in: firmicutes)]
MKQTIKEIEMILQSVTEPDDPFVKKCQQDERKGVQALLQRWKKKQEELMAEKRRFEKMMVYEKEAQKQGFQYVAGIDEVGRGPLEGPVVAAAGIL